MNATLADSQALQTPVLNAVAPYLAPGQSAMTFQKGELRGRLGRGVFRIQRLNLSSAIVQMAVVGSVTTGGRLDLNVTGNTGRLGYNPAFLRAVGLRIPAAGPIPVSLILEASALLSNRVVHLRVTGTVRTRDGSAMPSVARSRKRPYQPACCCRRAIRPTLSSNSVETPADSARCTSQSPARGAYPRP